MPDKKEAEVREARLKKALRDNLRRRKTAARRDTDAPASPKREGGAPDEE